MLNYFTLICSTCVAEVRRSLDYDEAETPSVFCHNCVINRHVLRFFCQALVWPGEVVQGFYLLSAILPYILAVTMLKINFFKTFFAFSNCIICVKIVSIKSFQIGWFWMKIWSIRRFSYTKWSGKLNSHVSNSATKPPKDLKFLTQINEIVN